MFNKVRRFVNLRSVNFVGSAESYDFIAVGKHEIILIESAGGLTDRRHGEER